MAADDRESELKRHRERAERVLAADHFAALGVARTASPDEINKAFVEAAKAWHPDRVPSSLGELTPLFARVFGRLDIARATLTDAKRRVQYLEELAAPPGKRPASNDTSQAEAALELKKAEVLLKKNDVAQAERHLRRAVQLAPANVIAQALLVWVQVKPASTPEELAKLVAELDRIIRLDERAERAFFFRGQLRKRLGREKEAHADFVRASELDRNNIDAQREVRLYKMRQEKQGAERSSSEQKAADASGGIGGLFQRLFNRRAK